ncbi:hypothetical protein ACIQU6_34170 [Streptomyces sp. NPDC090442]
MAVGPQVEAFTQAASRFADLIHQAQAVFNIGQLGATVVTSK